MWSKSLGVIPAFANVASPIADSGMMIPLTRSPLSQDTDHVQYMDTRL